MATESKSDPQGNFNIDLPPESFWVSKDDEEDWVNHNAFMQRKTSLKLGFNRNFTSFSHRSEGMKFRPSVFGLPKTAQKSSDGNSHEKKKASRFLLRSRSEPGGKSTHVSEPGSPRVSCTGRVGSKRCNGKKTGFSRLFSSLFRSGSTPAQR